MATSVQTKQGASHEARVLIPQPRARSGPQPRVTGPGRQERAYLSRVTGLEAIVERAQAELEQRRRALEIAALVERGSSRLIDRVEGDLVRQREELEEERCRTRRLAVGLGALQRENEELSRQLLEARQRVKVLGAARPGPRERGASRSFLGRLLGR